MASASTQARAAREHQRYVADTEKSYLHDVPTATTKCNKAHPDNTSTSTDAIHAGGAPDNAATPQHCRPENNRRRVTEHAKRRTDLPQNRYA